jgi:hypothetical protein
MKKIVFAIHGIRSGRLSNWVFDFVNFAKQDSRFKDDVLIPFTYGYVLALASVWPPYKYGKVKMLQEVLRKVVVENPDCELNIVAHSYGTELSYWAIKASGEDNKPLIMTNKLILVSSVVSRYNEIPYTDTLRAGKIKQLHCYCSFEDEVCRFAPFGHSGYAGFAKDRYDSTCYPKPFPDLEIYNHQVKLLEHCDYFVGTKYYQEWLDIIQK